MGKGRAQSVSRRAASHILHIAFQLKAILETQIHEQTGLLMSDNEALLNLAAAEAPMRMSTIADRLILSKGGTTKLIDRLEAKGLVVRRAEESDLRVLAVEITQKGRDVLAQIQPIVDDVIEAHFGAYLSDDESKTIIDVSRRVAAKNDGWVE